MKNDRKRTEKLKNDLLDIVAGKEPRHQTKTYQQYLEMMKPTEENFARNILEAAKEQENER